MTTLFINIKGYQVLIDQEDYSLFKQYNWRIIDKGHTQYVYSIPTMKDGIRDRSYRLHRLILNAPEGLIVDHINHNGLDNRRSNIRLGDTALNARNQKKKNIDTSSSKFKGVSKRNRSGKTYWEVSIRTQPQDTENKILAYARYENELQAACYFNYMFQKLFPGEQSVLNNIPETVYKEFIKNPPPMYTKTRVKQNKYFCVSKRQYGSKEIWEASFRYNHKTFYLGHYTTELEAAEAVDRKCIELGIPQKNNLIKVSQPKDTI
jgi:HNH endonuclease